MTGLRDLIDRAAWMSDAACRGMDPDRFFPPQGTTANDMDRLHEICASCPVRTECLDYALDNGEHDGIWGGLSARQRTSLRRRRQTERGPDYGRRPRTVMPRVPTLPPDDPRHGTHTGYSNHGCRCDDCTAANSRRSAARRLEFVITQ